MPRKLILKIEEDSSDVLGFRYVLLTTTPKKQPTLQTPRNFARKNVGTATCGFQVLSKIEKRQL